MGEPAVGGLGDVQWSASYQPNFDRKHESWANGWLMWDMVFEHEFNSHVYDSLDLDFAQIRFGEQVSLQSCTSTPCW